jgi:hypothetical protein
VRACVGPLAGILTAVVLATGPLAWAEETAAPRIRVEPSSFDFGKVKAQRTLRKEFRVLNLGERDLVIERISRSCGCTAATADAMTLAPGASTTLRVSVETRNSSGDIEHRVLVRSNDPEMPSLQIRLRATVVDAVP